MVDWDKASALLSEKLDRANVKSRSQGGTQVQYIEGWKAIEEANRIFGFDGWTRETIEMRECRSPEQINGNWRVGFICKARIVAGGIARDGTGYGSGIAKDLGDAYESAVKEAETDAMKRALMTFGNPFGLALYDKSRENVSEVPGQAGRIMRDMAMQAPSPLELFVGYMDKAATLKDLQDIWSNHVSLQTQQAAIKAKDRNKHRLSPSDLGGQLRASVAAPQL